MNKIEMFLAMILTNAKREEASSVVLTVERDMARIDMLLLDGSSQPLTAPPPEILLEIIGALEGGQRRFRSGVFEAAIGRVQIQRGTESLYAHVTVWDIEHVED